MFEEDDLNQIENIKDASIIDVRTDMEYEEEHIKGCHHITLQELDDNLEKIKAMPRPIIVYCRTGNRSGTAKEMLIDEGIEPVYNGINLETLGPLLN